MFPSLEQLHHATIITGNRQKNLESFKEFLVTQGVTLAGNPDITIFNEDQLLIDDARAISISLNSRSVSGKRYILIACDFFAADVQNTLLKTFEDPQMGTFIVLMVPTIESIIPTLLSRCQVISGNQDQTTSRLDLVLFLNQSYADRFTTIESWTKNKKDDDNLSKAEVLAFLDQVEQYFWKNGNRDESLFSDIRMLRDFAQSRGSSHRMLLDFLAMICPVVK